MQNSWAYVEYFFMQLILPPSLSIIFYKWVEGMFGLVDGGVIVIAFVLFYQFYAKGRLGNLAARKNIQTQANLY